MSERALHHRRTHNLLLIQRLLSLQGGSSPFTLVLDSVEQSSKPLIKEYIQRANLTKTTVVYISFETLKPPSGIDLVIHARRKPTTLLAKEISLAVQTPQKKSLLIIDTLHPLCSTSSLNLPSFLSSLITPQTSLLAIYHLNIPLPPSPPLSSYTPSPLTLLKYLATTVFTVHSISQTLARKRAADKSLAEPVFGLAEEKEGVVVGMGANDPRRLVLEMEHRRKSGRGVEEWFFLPNNTNPNRDPNPEVVRISSTTIPPKEKDKPKENLKEKISLLEDHPLYHPPSPPPQTLPPVASSPASASEIKDGTSTFNLHLTDQQRQDRDGVILPYFDAQKEGGGSGGRILYEMGAEDDFDEEEDEI